MNVYNFAGDSSGDEPDQPPRTIVDDDSTIPNCWVPPHAERQRAEPTRARVAMCGPAERAAVYLALQRATADDEPDKLAREVVRNMDDGVLAFLVRAFINGQLDSDGVLFIRPEELARLADEA